MEAASIGRAETLERTEPRVATKKAPKKEGTPWWMWLAVAAIVVFCLFPFYWLINVSLKTGPDLSDSALILSITTFPGIAIAAPIFKLWTDVGLFNTLPGLIIPYLCFSLPLAIYILVSFFKEIPRDLEEAALVDGATNFEAFTKIVIPLAAPGMATTAILTFIFCWNEFLLAVTLTSSPKARTVPAAIAFFTGSTEFEKPLGTISAASVIISIPLILLVLFFQKRIVAGLTAGAVKG